MFRCNFATLVIAILLLGALTGACAEQKRNVAITSQYDEARQEAESYGGPVHQVAKGLYDQGMAAYQAGNYAEAAEFLGQAADVGVANFPMRADARIYEAYSLLKINKYYEAYKVAQAAAGEYPLRWELRLILVEYWLWRGNVDQAFQETTIALRLAPTQSQVLRSAARVLRFRGDLTGAAEVARSAAFFDADSVHVKRDLAEIYIERAVELERDGDLDGALTECFAASTCQPKDPTPPILIGRVLLRLGLPAAAKRYTLAGRQLIDNPEEIRKEVFTLEMPSGEIDADEHRKMAEFYFGRDQAELGAQELEMTLAADPHQPDAWHRLGMLHADNLGDLLRARQCLHALWILDAAGRLAQELEDKLKLAEESPMNTSPGFVMRSEAGSGFDMVNRKTTDTGQAIAVNHRVFTAIVLGSAAGKHNLRVKIVDPSDQTIMDEAIDIEFFGKDFAVVRTGSWTLPGEYEVQWWMDGMKRADSVFILQ